MYRIRIRTSDSDEFIIDGKVIGLANDEQTRAIVNLDEAAELIAKENGIIVKAKGDPVKNKRLVIVSDEFPTVNGKKTVVHISPKIEFIISHMNRGVEFSCKGGRKYRFFLLQ